MCLENGLATPAVCYHGRVFSEAFVVAPKYYPRPLLWQHKHVMRKDPLWLDVWISSGFVEPDARCFAGISHSCLCSRGRNRDNLCKVGLLGVCVLCSWMVGENREEFQKQTNHHIEGI